MARELRVNMTIPLPDGVFEEADVLAKAKPIVDELTARAGELAGVVEFEVVTPKPRGAKEEAPAPKLTPVSGQREAA